MHNVKHACTTVVISFIWMGFDIVAIVMMNWHQKFVQSVKDEFGDVAKMKNKLNGQVKRLICIGMNDVTLVTNATKF